MTEPTQVDWFCRRCPHLLNERRNAPVGVNLMPKKCPKCNKYMVPMKAEAQK